MYATVRRIKEEFQEQLSVVIKQLGKPEKDQKSEFYWDCSRRHGLYICITIILLC